MTSHLRSLLLIFGTYLPPPTSLSGAANIPTATRSTRVPPEVLTDAVLEEIKTRCCFVGEALDLPSERVPTPGAMPPEDSISVDIPPSEPPSESGVSSSLDIDASRQSSSPSVFSETMYPPGQRLNQARPENHLRAIATMYTRYSTATDLSLKVVPPLAQQMGTGRGTLIIPGWIRERASEVLFEGGDVDENSVAEVLLESLLKVWTSRRCKCVAHHGTIDPPRSPQGPGLVDSGCRRNCYVAGVHSSLARGACTCSNAA